MPRLLEDGSTRLIESGFDRLLENDTSAGVTTRAVTGLGWRGLYETLAADEAYDGSILLVSCPLCGEPLEQARGVLHCRFDGTTYPVGSTASRPGL